MARRADVAPTEDSNVAALSPLGSRPPQSYRLSVVIPCYNERDKLPLLLTELIRQIPQADAREIVIVDDGSTDGTRDWLESLAGGEISSWFPVQIGADDVPRRATSVTPGLVSVYVHFQPENQGKGAALRAGFALSRYEVIVVQDADLEYDPRDLNSMFALIASGSADVVYGSRFRGKSIRTPYRYHDGGRRPLYPHHFMANWVISRFVGVLCGSSLTDVEVCYKMFRREVVESMTLVSNDFGLEVEFTVKTLLTGRWRIQETDISYYPRTASEGKKINWKDGVRALWYAVSFRFFQ